ncbi:hypothetical protein Q4577_10370 [Marinovum sp. 2_MG-2023]|uniref:hypothetical protein n=1 Tax=unclassified Marinovum TaxID=2647166 RepID=UPI0026E3DDBA|nr:MULTISPECIES: hypothetical protein [unclassified Marinovum]MDO6730426.1 hypothetical protein [Marinovum sp. 2_MG-2023]MDO6778406.1 hypothetical protein [Marinovum sp. 1_MG-2023]
MTVRFVPIILDSHHQDPGEADTDQALSNFLESIGPDDDIVFFYAGHGRSYQGINYLLPADASRDGSARLPTCRSLWARKFGTNFSTLNPSFANRGKSGAI